MRAVSLLLALCGAFSLGGCFQTSDNVMPFDRSDTPPTAPGVYYCTSIADYNALAGEYTFDVFHGHNGQPQYVISHHNPQDSGIIVHRVTFARMSPTLYLMAIQNPITDIVDNNGRKFAIILKKTGYLPRVAPAAVLIARMQRHSLEILDTTVLEAKDQAQRMRALKKFIR